MSQHTPEPWHQSSRYLYDKDWHTLAAFCTTNRDAPPEQDIANTQRIVACVNACAGIADPAATLAALRALLDDVADMLEDRIGYDNTAAHVRSMRALLGGAE